MRRLQLALNEQLRAAAGKLAEAGIEEPLWEARWLLEHIAKIPVEKQLISGDLLLTPELIEAYDEAVTRRVAHEPFAYIVGEVNFHGYDFYVENCLIPRPETELVVDAAVEAARQIAGEDRKLAVLDLCAGSGCIGISTALQLFSYEIETELTLADISEPALATAKRNLERYDLEGKIIVGDLFEAIEGTFDLIVSNPPYIRSAELPELIADVRDYEPAGALDGGEDGLEFYRRIAAQAEAYLKPTAALITEHGMGQRTALRNIFKPWRKRGWQEKTRDDYRGIDRVYGYIRDEVKGRESDGDEHVE